MLSKFKEFWVLVTVGAAIGTGVFVVKSVVVTAADVKRAVDSVKADSEQFKQALSNLSEIASEVRSTKFGLRKFLEMNGISDSLSKTWSNIPWGRDLVDSSGEVRKQIPFLYDERLPYIGIYLMRQGSGDVIVLDTLWDIRDRSKGE
ncbi:hypothetical protein C4561_01390 [candidate division WWE3 bacterium]|uniref:Uncharacterized protein n=1 Tax=candidate division WWE3 bacterium TaxID=2053526 RepID=A0A3A4ZMH2_UNCKA|nr:MAG: hypothetical protein C4561_01390 [candidate division WWE3 bacterium]